MCLKKNEVFENIDRNEIAEIIKRRANKTVIEGGNKMSVKEMIKKEIDKLPENLLPEVFDFIQFLESKRERIMTAKTSQCLSTASFQKIWDNEEDAVYDSL